MWLLFTVSILLAREVVGNLSTDKHNEEKKVENKNYLHNFSQLQTTDLKIPAEKLHEIDKSNKKQDTEKRRKRSIDEIGSSHETFAIDFEKRKGPMSSWFYWTDKDAIPIKERSKESSQEKKTPRFSPWGGKRSETYLSDPEFRQNTHVFNSWGGKRVNEFSKLSPPSEKNAKLYAWNSIGSNENLELKRVSKSNTEGKVPFNSWGGKRALNNIDYTSPILQDLHQFEGEIAYRKRKGDVGKYQEKLIRKMDERRAQKFGSWGGKRFANQQDEKMDERRAQKFESWGGKRFANQQDDEKIDEKRAQKFGSWGGKRFAYQQDDEKIDEKRAQKFGSWGGKRFANQQDGENLHLADEDFFESLKSRLPKKRANRALRKREFQPWGGKRSPETIPENPNDTERRPPASFFVRKVFFPWGG
ncbi:uncharacterized protein LOC127281710 isoform X2 [Leptopilina boulardi]|uniref:uncharacterized protein LOC127281710 isoform X2 n=1 Tax=Leptopilina boulardi TaxID=63433 RepID=UPI0021F52CAC|nr:uncharacterized protein LOC127281710 isoform X2 [Leptopilina boulardi]